MLHFIRCFGYQKTLALFYTLMTHLPGTAAGFRPEDKFPETINMDI
jgi:hypothetical protein